MIMNYINKNNANCIRCLVFMLFLASGINAQYSRTVELPPEVMAWTISNIEPWPEGRYSSLSEAMIDNKFYMPLVFNGGVFPKLDYRFSRDSLSLTDAPPPLFKHENRRVNNMFRHYLFKKELEEIAYRDVMLKEPRNFRYISWQLPNNVVIPESIDKSGEYVKLDIKTTTTPPDMVDPVIKFIPDRKYWKSSFSADIKFSQNRSTSNWYKGEINNMNIYTNTITSYNYSRDRLSLTNTLSTTFTINNAPNDTLRKYTIGNDEVRFRSNFGLKAIGNWDYSTSAEVTTSVGDKYMTNTHIKNSAFMSPYTVNVGFGMTFKANPNFKKKDRSLKLDLSLEPFSFKYMHSKDKDINLSAHFQKDENGNYMHVFRTFGSTITMKKFTRFSKSVTWDSRLYYFTNYERVISEMENKFDIALSKYFATTIYIYLRYDDGVARAADSSTYLQINEMFAFGFSYRW